MDDIRGTILRPGDEGFDAETTGYQLAWAHRPDVVVLPVDADDVATAQAAAAGRHVAVQLTGHGRTTPLDGGVLISTRLLTGVTIDPDARTARVGAGARWGDVVAAAAKHGLAPLSGSSPEVGVVGYLLGGGLGLLGRRYGWAGDHVRSMDRAGDVVTGVEIELFPVATIWGGGAYFDADRIADVIAAYRDWTATVPDATTSSLAVVPMPDVEAVPAPIRGKRVAQVRVVHPGPVEEGEQLVEPLRAIGPRLMERFAEMPFAEATSIYSDPPSPHPYLGTNALLTELAPEVAAAVVAADDQVVQINHLGGALTGEAQYLLRILAVVEDEAAVRRAQAAVTAAAAAWTVGRLPGFDFGPRR